MKAKKSNRTEIILMASNIVRDKHNSDDDEKIMNMLSDALQVRQRTTFTLNVENLTLVGPP